jgi:hypothetical protein
MLLIDFAGFAVGSVRYLTVRESRLTLLVVAWFPDAAAAGVSSVRKGSRRFER